MHLFNVRPPVATSIYPCTNHRVYYVTNTGNVNLTITSLEDDQIGTLVLGDAYQTSSKNNDAVLEPGETWTFGASGNATPGNYTNVGRVNATHGPTGAEVTSSDPSSYFGHKGGQVCQGHGRQLAGEGAWCGLVCATVCACSAQHKTLVQYHAGRKHCTRALHRQHHQRPGGVQHHRGPTLATWTWW